MKGYMTAQRRLLVEYFEQHCDRQLTAEQIAADMQSGEISRSAVYRNIDRMVKEGQLRRFATEDGRFTYQYVASAHCCEHIHMQCTRCGKIFHMEDHSAETALNAALAESDFKIDRQRTVLYGVCGGCN